MEARQKNRRSRRQNISKKTSCSNKTRLKNAITQANEAKTGIDSDFLITCLSSVDDFHGVLTQDQLHLFTPPSIPISFIVNLDNSNQSGSHWIGIRISEKYFEIYDSLDVHCG